MTPCFVSRQPVTRPLPSKDRLPGRVFHRSLAPARPIVPGYTTNMRYRCGQASSLFADSGVEAKVKLEADFHDEEVDDAQGVRGDTVSCGSTFWERL